MDVTVLYGDPALPDSEKVDRRFTREDRAAIERMKAALAALPALQVEHLEHHADLLPRLLDDPPAFVLNFCDTGYRNDPRKELHVPAVLEMVDVPYSGAGPACLGLCYDKCTVRAIAQTHGLPVPAETFVGADAETVPLPDRYPAFVKPATGDGSVGITADSVVHSATETRDYVDHLRREMPTRDVLIQEYLQGPEYTVGLVGNPEQELKALPPLAVDYSGLDPELPPILAYESKAVADSPFWTQITYRDADLDPALRDTLLSHARFLFRRLGCRDYARVDYRCDRDGQPHLLEVNPNPAWCWDGKMNVMAGFAGHDYRGFLQMIVEAARRRMAAPSPPTGSV
jgi:D-alanine-D-alanine ligase